MADFVIVLGADADARFLPEDEPMRLLDVPTSVGRVDLTYLTRFAEEGYESPVPREMWIDARGSSDLPLSEVVSAYGNAAAGFLPAIAVANNVYIGDIYPKIGYDATATATTRAYFQSFLREERGTVPRPGRWVETSATASFIAVLERHAQGDRLRRAIAQYALALGHWRYGHEILAVAHLFIASEALTPIALATELERTWLDREGLAKRWSIEPRALDAEVRRRLIFQGDSAIYTSAKKASDGFEHGFLDFDRVRQLSRDVRDSAATYVRTAIFKYSSLEQPLRATLESSPRDIPMRSHLTRYFWGDFLGEAADLAQRDLEYPHFEWTSRLKAFKRTGRVVTFTPEETPVGRFSDAVQFRPARLEVWGPNGVTSEPAGPQHTRIIRAHGQGEEAPPGNETVGSPPRNDLTPSKRHRHSKAGDIRLGPILVSVGMVWLVRQFRAARRGQPKP